MNMRIVRFLLGTFLAVVFFGGMSVFAATGKPVAVLSVPFISQAPYAEWANSIFKYGCEEASALMAVRWARGETLTKKQARDEIVKMSAFEKKNYGFYEDTSAADTIKLIRDYFKFSTLSLREDITVDDIIKELQKGNIVIVPVHGQKLNNPYYNPPGPVEHMMIVKGYDPATRKIITNDPGTRRGEGLRYDRNIFERALRDYPSGFKEPITEIKKVMIVVSKEKKK